jgi:hypothetical protein
VEFNLTKNRVVVVCETFCRNKHAEKKQNRQGKKGKSNAIKKHTKVEEKKNKR